MSEKEVDKSKTLVMTIPEILSSINWTDKRKPRWMKIVTGVDLSKVGGYALLGDFIGESYSAVIKPGDWVVLGGDAYALVRNVDGKLQRILVQPIIEQIKSELDPQTYANARNSVLYAYAVVIDYYSKKEGNNMGDQKKILEEMFKSVEPGKLFEIILSDGRSTIYADSYKFSTNSDAIEIFYDDKLIAELYSTVIKQVIQP